MLLYALCGTAGAGAGLLGSFVHPVRTAGLPAGLLVGLLLSGLVFAGSAAATRARSGAGLAALGWLVPVVALSAPRAEGDLVVAATGLGYAWLVGGLLLAGATVARSPSARPSGPPDPGR